MCGELVRVPPVVAWPRRAGGGAGSGRNPTPAAAAGASCDDFVVHCLDLGPTLLEFAGVGGSDPAGPAQGICLAPRLEGRQPDGSRDFVFSTHSGQQFGLFSQRMIHDRRYKLVWNVTDADELYHL